MKKHDLQLLCACLAGFAFSANYTNHAPLAAVLMKEFDFTKTMAGFLTTGIFATHAIMQVPAGHWADKFGGKKVLIVALFIVCVGNVGIAFANSYNQLLFWKIFVGFGTGASFVSAARYLAQVMPEGRLYQAQGFYGASVLMGSGFVIFAVPQLAQWSGWSSAFLTTAVLAVLVLLIWIVIAPPAELKQHQPISLISLLSHGQLWLLGFIQMGSFGLVLVIGSWVTELLKTKLELAPVFAGYVGSLILLLGIFTRIYGGVLGNRIGYRRVLIGSLSLNVVGCFLLAFNNTSLVLAILAIMLIGAGSGLPYSALFNRAVALFPGRGGAAMGLVNMLGIVMILGGAPLVGRIADWTGDFSSAFITLGLFAFLTLLASLKIKSATAQP